MVVIQQKLFSVWSIKHLDKNALRCLLLFSWTRTKELLFGKPHSIGRLKEAWKEERDLLELIRLAFFDTLFIQCFNWKNNISTWVRLHPNVFNTRVFHRFLSHETYTRITAYTLHNAETCITFDRVHLQRKISREHFHFSW